MSQVRRQTVHFSVYAAPGSFADRNLGLIASRLESAYSVFASLLAVDVPAGGRLDVYLPEILGPGEAGAETTPGPSVGRKVVEAYRADAPAPGLERALLQVLIRL